MNGSFDGFSYTPHGKQPGPPFAPTSADNGLSVDPITGRIVLGNDFFGTPLAALSNQREIPLNTFQIYMTDAANNFLMQFSNQGIVALDTSPTASRSEINASPSGAFLAVESDSALAAAPQFQLTDLATIPFNNARIIQNGTEFHIAAAGGTRRMLLGDVIAANYQFGDIDAGGFGSKLNIQDTIQRLTYESGGNSWLFLDPANLFFELGQVGSLNSLLIDGTNLNAHIFLNGANALLLDNATGVYSLGDIDSVANSSTITVDDVNARIFLSAGNGVHSSPPSGAGTDGAWKFGKTIAAVVAFDPTQYVEVDIDGTLVKLAIAV